MLHLAHSCVAASGTNSRGNGFPWQRLPLAFARIACGADVGGGRKLCTPSVTGSGSRILVGTIQITQELAEGSRIRQTYPGFGDSCYSTLCTRPLPDKRTRHQHLLQSTCSSCQGTTFAKRPLQLMPAWSHCDIGPQPVNTTMQRVPRQTLFCCPRTHGACTLHVSSDQTDHKSGRAELCQPCTVHDLLPSRELCAARSRMPQYSYGRHVSQQETPETPFPDQRAGWATKLVKRSDNLQH